ncbi:318_t:CDS:10 [Ambispora gerdemannii]|uniref:318_t:CDS:1 n=1 Tax=Ambispora gerdemannii TaxID=144530 RepID=A0A9N8ZJ57_9GLOM|nr:318_t:CDS:10 [Ambispora gerdemannii]
MNTRMHEQINNDKEEREPKISNKKMSIIKDYVNLAELLHKTVHGIVRVFDEFLIPTVMSHLDLKTHDSITTIQELFRILADLFDLPNTSYQIVAKHQIKKDWKNLLASKFVSTGLLEIALQQNYNFRQIQPNTTNGFDRFLVAVIGRLSGFLPNVGETGGNIRQGSIVPENFAFGNLPENLTGAFDLIANDIIGSSSSSSSTTINALYVSQTLDRAALALLFVVESNRDKRSDTEQDDNITPPATTSKKGYKALSRFLTKYASLDFLHDMIKWLHYNFNQHQKSLLPEITIILSKQFETTSSSLSIVDEKQILQTGEMLFGNEFAVEILLSLFTNSILNDKTDDQQEQQQSFQFRIVVLLTITLLSPSFSSSSSKNIKNDNKNYDNNDGEISNPVIKNLLVFWTSLLKYATFGGNESGILLLERLPLDWWQPINHILMVLGKRFNRYVADNLGSLSEVFDYTLRYLSRQKAKYKQFTLLQSINEYEEIAGSKKDNNEKEPENEIFFIAEKFLFVVNFLSILADISTKKALIEIQQHPLILPALRDRISRKSISTADDCKYRLIEFEIVSVVLGLLNKSIPVQTDGRREATLFPSMNEILLFLHMAKIESALMVGHLCTIVKRGFDLTLEDFRKNTKWIYISIWNILRDFVVSEVDNQFMWFLLLPISDSFRTMMAKSPPQLGFYLIENRWNFYMLRNVLRLLEFFTLQNPSWIKEIFTENVIDMIISLLDQIVTSMEQRSCAVVSYVKDDESEYEELCRVLLNIVQKLLQISLITKTHHHYPRIARVLDSFVLHRQEQLSNTLTEKTTNSKTISEELLFIRPRPNYKFMLTSLTKHHHNDHKIKKLEVLKSDSETGSGIIEPAKEMLEKFGDKNN